MTDIYEVSDKEFLEKIKSELAAAQSKIENVKKIIA